MDRTSNFPWVIALRSENASAIGALRQVAGVEVGEDYPLVWVRGPASDFVTVALLASLSCVSMYEWTTSNTLRPLGSRLSSGSFPAVKWEKLSDWFSVVLPSSRFSAPRITTVLHLVRSAVATPVNAILADLSDFVNWADTAPLIRLKGLKYAVSSEGKVLVVGNPLPTLSFQAMVETQGIIVPAGWTWSPNVSVKTLKTALRIDTDKTVLWTDLGVQVIHSEMFVPATRASIRAACLNHSGGLKL